VFAAGDELGFGAAVAFGDADALALGAGEGDFFVAAEATMGTEQARAAMQAVIKCSVFFISGVLSGKRF
jgi:hypothetical protein